MHLKYRLYIFFNFLIINTYCQETPYYQEPVKRKDAHEKMVMPNLNSFTIKYYSSLSGGFSKDYIKSKNDISIGKKAQSQMLGFFEFNLGVNRNEKYFFETGFSQVNQQLNTYYNIPFAPFQLQNDQRLWMLPVRAKRTLWVMDRVSRSAFLVAGMGLNFRLNSLKEKHESKKYLIQYRQTPPIDALESMEYEMVSVPTKINFETMVEIRGKVTERVELGLFSKAVVSKSGNLSNQLIVNYFNGKSETSLDKTKGIQLIFGLVLRINSPAYYRYTPTLE